MRKLVVIVLISAAITFICFQLASCEPWGYQVLESRAETTINHLNVDVVETVTSGYVKISFNPVFFPINHVSGNGIIFYSFTRYTPPVHLARGGGRGDKIVPEETGYVSGILAGSGMVADIGAGLAIDEFLKNMPLFFFGTLFIVYLSSRLLTFVRTHSNNEEEIIK